jgi:hypothetical protein
VRDIRITHQTFAIYPVTNQILQRASEAFPTVVGTLDGIHLATALSIREIESIEFLLTHDFQLATAARSLGFEVTGKLMNEVIRLLPCHGPGCCSRSTHRGHFLKG